MATRNRTALYKKKRDASMSVRAPLSSSESGSTGPVIEMVSGSFLRSNHSSYTPLSTEDPGPSSREAFTVGLPPAWVDDFEEISVNIQRARIKMAELVKVHAKALMPSFGDGKEDQRTIEVLTHEITGLLRRSEQRLQKISLIGSSEDSNIRKNVQRSLATDLQTLSVDLRRKQSTYLKRLQQQNEGHDGVDLERNFNVNKVRFEDDGSSDVGFDEHQMMKLKRSERFSEEREREIKQVVESVNELAQIMKDLSVLVIDQGTIVDRIDHNIQNVATSVEEGYKQLQKVNTMFMGNTSLDWCLAIAGRENPKEGRNGHVCDSACYYVLHHASALDPQRVTLVNHDHDRITVNDFSLFTVTCFVGKMQ